MTFWRFYFDEDEPELCTLMHTTHAKLYGPSNFNDKMKTGGLTVNKVFMHTLHQTIITYVMYNSSEKNEINSSQKCLANYFICNCDIAKRVRQIV